MRKDTHPAIRSIWQFLKIVSLCVLPGFLFSQQNSTADSLARLLKTARPDTSKVNLLNDLAWELRTENLQQATLYLDAALALARQLNFKKGEGNALNFKGVIEDIHGNSDAAIKFFQQALAIREQLGDRQGVASLYNNIGNVKDNLGDYVAALENYQNSLRIREEMKDTARMVRAYYNIAIVLENMGNYPEALDYIFQYLEGTEQTGNQVGVANAWNVIGNIKTETDRYEEALRAYERSLAIHRQLKNDWETASVLNNIANLKDAMAEQKMETDNLGDTVLSLFNEAVVIHREAMDIRKKLEDVSGEAEILNNIGYVLKNLGSYYMKSGNPAAAANTWKEAESYLLQSLELRQKEGNKAGIMLCINGLADVRRRQKRFPEALDYTRQYYKIALEINDAKYQQNALKDLARIHYAIGEYKKAYEYREQYDELRYTRFNEDRIKSEEKREMVYGDRKKQFEIQRQQQELALRDAQLKTANTVRNSLIGGALLLLLMATVLLNRNKIIRKEKHRSEELLLNILPAQTAEELKVNGKAQARRYEAATVLFTDFQSFTQIAEKTSPEDLVTELDECFRAFDEIVTRYGIEKIKTIGDAYLCAAGLPAPSETHAEDTVRAALAMQSFMATFRERQRKAGKPEFYCRIGIHSGPLVAGVVGKKKFAYDIWGDTVNLAARMEQSGEPDRINISQTTFDHLNGKFKCSYRGKVKAKNKGELEMYFVEAEIGEKASVFSSI